MAANFGLLQIITDMLTKTLKKISKIERNILKMANNFNKGCEQNVSAYE
jgi:hypothetical protein